MPRQPVWRVFTSRRELRVLWLVGVALRLPARRVDAREPGVRRRDSAHDHSGRRKALLWLAVLANLGTLAYLKYAGFFLSSAQNVLSTLGLESAFPIVATALPVGVSFYTFMALSYVIDIYRGTLAPTSLSKFAVFLSFYPHLVAGPTSGARSSSRNSSPLRDRTARRSDASVLLIATGLFMKVVIAELAGDRHRRSRLRGARASRVDECSWHVRLRGPDLGDFCRLHRHRDRHRAAARLPVPENFDAPYIARSACRTSGDAGT